MKKDMKTTAAQGSKKMSLLAFVTNDEPTQRGSKPHATGWKTSTELSVDLKTCLRRDRRMKSGKVYRGTLRRDVTCEEFNYDEHYTFVEGAPETSEKRNPHVYVGRYITVTQRDDGTLRPNFRPLRIDDDFTVEGYAIGVSNELLWALGGLIER